ncbi:hypothetical protein T03_11857 [Trichinella britovi]|uniref:Uncharacterized protein n=2 Tax=Trichinella TaxID=6333 RepID=A0A0V1CR46_TRIBR|nr:hypothetical protein T05_9125 [Trichinella murrelli]KRX77579.1 hypothetical protein T06_4666 [Trichinella sp. T6]KRY51638.1 hypothetical protein T03_11857 [Trichinella britovi]KRZ91736.1 hypothetical protein T08_1214 [Trichinella sp. T8]
MKLAIGSIVSDRDPLSFSLDMTQKLVEAVAIAIVKIQSRAAEGDLPLAECFKTNFPKQDNNIRKWACEQENVQAVMGLFEIIKNNGLYFDKVFIWQFGKAVTEPDLLVVICLACSAVTYATFKEQHLQAAARFVGAEMITRHYVAPFAWTSVAWCTGRSNLGEAAAKEEAAPLASAA